MGNCQAVDAAALVIQHPNGKLERMYCSLTASQVMKMNPGHYVSLIIPLTGAGAGEHSGDNSDGRKTVRFTLVKLLRPTDTLVLGRAYRLVTSHDVMKVLRAKRYAKMKKELPESMAEKQRLSGEEETRDELEDASQATRDERILSQRSGSSSSFGASRSKSWRPSLQSISEAAS